MLTRHNIITESPHVEAIPINLVTTEDGRTLLAVTEHKDGMMEIVATPVTLIGQNGSPTSLVDVKNFNENFILHSPIFQLNIEDIVDGTDLQQPTENVEPGTATNDRLKSQMSMEAKCKTETSWEYRSPLQNDLTTINKQDESSVQKSVNDGVKRSSPGRPKKTATVSLQGTECLRCDICHQEFVKRTLYRKHMENHAEEKPHRCPKCSASFNVPTNFTLHMATHNTGEPKCPECGKKFTRMASLKSHMLLHEKEENLFCTECEDAFSTKAQLDAHLKLHGEKWATEEARKCKLCNKQFSQPALYRLHIREHYRLQTKVAKQTKKGTKHKTVYKCTICLKSFQKPSQLMRHIRVHTGEKPFKCTVCSRAFTQKSSLQIHTWQHNGIRPHACELCNAKFSQKGNLNAHIMRVHNVPEGEPIYGCNYCSCIFKKLGSLNGHMKRMHADIDEEGTTVADATSDTHPADIMESDIRATVDSVITQLASLEANTEEIEKSSNSKANLLSEGTMKKDILQEALKNSGLPSKNKTLNEGTTETKKLGARTNFVTLLDRAPDGGTRKYLTIKQRCVGNIRWYACTFCHKEFKKSSDLIRHLRVHTQEKPFKCTHCYRSFALKSTMIAHERTHSGTKRYACDSCDKTFACHGSLVGHTRLHGKSKKNCNKTIVDDDKNSGAHTRESISGVCQSSVNQSKVQAKNKSKLSPEAESLAQQVVLQEPLVISDTGNKICVAQVASKEKRAYDASTDPARPHKCLVCQAAFRKISHLKQHHRRHTGERPYECTKCDRRFTSNSVLKSHLHTHEDWRPYGCPICDAKFSTQSSMKRHLVTHSNKRPFMCPYCHKTFKTYVNCRKHMKIHKHELAQRQLEQQKLQMQEQSTEQIFREDSKEMRALESSCSPSVSNATSTNVVTTVAATSAIITTAVSTFSDNLTSFSRLGAVEISFQPQLGTDFSQTFPEQEKTRPVLSGNCDASTFINHNISETVMANLENTQMLHADETGSVTLPPVYSGDQALTPESIREIEETLNQQFFNIGMNINLENSHSRHSNNANPNDFEGAKGIEEEQQTVLNVMYENTDNDNTSNNNNNDKKDEGNDSNVEPSEEHVFSSQLDSFEMDHIALQSDTEIDIGLVASDSTSMVSILPRTAKEHRLSTSVTTSEDAQDRDDSGKTSIQTVVFISQENLSRKEDATTELEGVNEDDIRKQCVMSPMLLTEGFGGSVQQETIKNQSEVNAMSSCTNKISHGESLLQCHMCSQQGFTAIGLKEHLKTHRGTKEYQCTECSSRFCTNGGLNRHSKIHVVKQSWKCSSCEKYFSSRTQLRSHSKIHEISIWNAMSTGTENSQIVTETSVSSDLQPVTNNGDPCLNDIAIDPDSAVSEKVLLDTMAEKAVMDQIETVSGERRERKEYTNKCKSCPKTFRKPSDLIRHVRTHTGERPYKCDFCSKSFAVKCTLDSHTKVHTGKKTFRCHVCNSMFATKGSLKVHMRLHTGSKPFKCPVCDSRFRTSGHRKVHLLKHAREHKESPKRKQKHLKVAAIAEVAADLEKLGGNIEKTSSFELDQQQQQLPQTKDYPHLETISVETAATCLTDQINFDTDTDTDAAIVSNNNPTMAANEGNQQLVTNLHFLLTNGLVTIQTEESLLSQSTSVNNVSYNRSTMTSDSVCIPTLCISSGISNNDHAKEDIHTGQMMKAQLPSSSSSSSSHQKKSNNCLLTVATSTVQMEQPLSKVFADKSLSTTTKTLTKGNSARKECDICGKTFTKPYQVERHKRIHTGDRPYKCDLCTKSFAQKSTLQMHQKHHTGDRPYACPYCEYSFTQKGNLRTHVRRVHQLDTINAKKLKRGRQYFLPKSIQDSVLETKTLNLDDIPFVEFLK
ncbi:zinc finger protein 236-like isoform X2 [Osmia bicornis bicornis]|uniref:zinc finger protein 236-like isoform X2 n=1 Tax=Osmia bicornis bicornis TaxID=1437191 RepID=UPI001EAEEEE3|nr:zinc finger protein 236-like isoform X2 [Osmia bicornis bicornis]